MERKGERRKEINKDTVYNKEASVRARRNGEPYTAQSRGKGKVLKYGAADAPLCLYCYDDSRRRQAALDAAPVAKRGTRSNGTSAGLGLGEGALKSAKKVRRKRKTEVHDLKDRASTLVIAMKAQSKRTARGVITSMMIWRKRRRRRRR